MTPTSLHPGERYKCLGEAEWHTVGELRANISQGNDMNDTAPDIYGPGLAALRAAEARPSTDQKQAAVTIAAMKTAAVNDELARFAADWRLNQTVEREIERHNVAEADARAAEASKRLGVPIAELRFAVDHDDIPKAPDGYQIAIDKMRSGR